MIGHRRFVAYGDEGYPNPTTDFDAYVAERRDEKVPTSVVSSRGANEYNNFDTDEGVMYEYTPDSPEEAKDKVQMYAGRMNGGDFKWVFDNAKDDADYAVNPALKQVLVAYKTQLIAVQADGGGNNQGGDDPGDDDDPDEITGNVVHNFTTDGIQSVFFAISGNLSDSKGTATYGGQTLTQCLKMESSTNILFTTSDEAQLTLVLNEDFIGEIKVDGVSYSAINGIVVVSISEGSHSINKDDVANLYMMIIDYGNGWSEMSFDGLLSVYPNPVSTVLNLITNVKIEALSVCNLNGERIIQKQGMVQQIDFDGYPNGIYLLHLISDRKIYTTTIIKR